MNIEMPILALFRNSPELLDLHVDDALSALASRYRAEEQGKEVSRRVSRDWPSRSSRPCSSAPN